jgi:hypothetical protein
VRTAFGGQRIEDHFVNIPDMVEIGKGGFCGAIIVQNRENGRFFMAFSRLCWQKREIS